MRHSPALLKNTFNAWRERKATRLAAALAFYTVFSVAPLLIVGIAIAGLVFGREAAQGQIVSQISGLVGREGAEIIQTVVENARKPSASILATVIGLVTLLLGAAAFHNVSAVCRELGIYGIDGVHPRRRGNATESGVSAEDTIRFVECAGELVDDSALRPS